MFFNAVLVANRVRRAPRGKDVHVENAHRERNPIAPRYDSIIAKVIARGPTHDEAIERLDYAFVAFEIIGVKITVPAERMVLAAEPFREDWVQSRPKQECFAATCAARVAP